MLTVVFVEPETPGNLGACARVMANFGFSDLFILNPCFSLSHPQVKALSKHAYGIIEASTSLELPKEKILPFLKERFDYIIGTTSQIGNDFNLVRSPLAIEEFTDVLKKRFKNFRQNPGVKIALLLGREGEGLTNKELNQCDFVVSIPANPSYPTLNVSHALALMLYELFKVSEGKDSISHLTLATKKEKDMLLKRYRELLDSLEFDDKHKRETQERVFRRIVGRSFFKKREVFVLHGLISRILQKLQK